MKLNYLTSDNELRSLYHWNFVSKYNTSGLINCNTNSVNDEYTNEKKIIKVVDYLGRNSSVRPNIPYFIICDDGTVKAKINIQ